MQPPQPPPGTFPYQPGPPSQPYWSSPVPPYQGYPPGPPKRRFPWAIVVAVSLVSLVAIIIAGVVGFPIVSHFIDPRSYVAADDTGALFVQWVEHDSTMNGTYQVTSVDATSGTAEVTSQSLDFTGIQDGSHITMTFHGLLGATSTINGTLSFRTLTLEIPQPSGEIQSVVLVPGDASDYNAAVASLQRAHPTPTPQSP
jgi:hypothetical protein